jgi:hypothetical protein
MPACAFSSIDPVRIIRQSATVIAFFDDFPISEGTA